MCARGGGRGVAERDNQKEGDYWGAVRVRNAVWAGGCGAKPVQGETAGLYVSDRQGRVEMLELH